MGHRDPKDAAAEELARAHFAVDPEIERIVRIVTPNEADPQEPVRLLEVSPNTIPEGIVPVGFGPGAIPGTGYTAAIVEVTPIEAQQVEQGALSLPNGWRLGKVYLRPAKQKTEAR